MYMYIHIHIYVYIYIFADVHSKCLLVADYGNHCIRSINIAPSNVLTVALNTPGATAIETCVAVVESRTVTVESRVAAVAARVAAVGQPLEIGCTTTLVGSIRPVAHVGGAPNDGEGCRYVHIYMYM